MADPNGINVAYGSAALSATPTWTRIDDPAGISVVNSWSVRRGRQYLTDRMEAGTATVGFVDHLGKLDPTNVSGPFYPMNPNCPGIINVHNPIANTWTTLFRGLIQGCPQDINIDSAANRGTIEMADLFSLLAIDEVPPGLDFDDSALGTSASNTNGNTTYAATDVQSRIKAILADAGIPSALTDIFTGNVNVQFTSESPGTQILAALQDAADAEFPGVANIYVDKTGIVTFHGRRARFNPAVSGYHISTWHAGDTAATASNDWALLQGIQIDRDVTKIINASRFTPQGILDGDIAGQLVDDATSITDYGPRALSGDNLLTAGGLTDGLNANDETKLFASYYVDNLKDPQTRINQCTLRTLPSAHPRASKTWQMILGVDLNDIVQITTTHPGGGGFSAEPYFVEGISYSAEMLPPATPGGEAPWDITCTLDLSSTAYFTTEPWDDDHT